MTSTPRSVHRFPGDLLVLAAILILGTSAGCSTTGKRTEQVLEGSMAARHQAEDQLAADAGGKPQPPLSATSAQPSTQTPPTVGEGAGPLHLPSGTAPMAVPTTAPPPDQFDKDNAAHLLARCRDRMARKEWFDAVGDCRRSSELAPASIEPQVELMRVYVTLSSFPDAETAARKVLAAKPNDPVALYYLAWSYRGRERFPEAIDTLKKVVALDPGRAEFVQALGMTYCLAGNYGKGIAEFERALQIRPGDEQTRSMIAAARKAVAEKVAPYEKMVQGKPESYDNHAALGSIYQKYGLSERALASYDAALSKIPEPIAAQPEEVRKLASELYYNRALVYRDLGRLELAEPTFTRAMQVNPSLSAFCWYYIGLGRLERGDLDASIEALRKSVSLAGDVADNRTALAEAYDKAGKNSAAAEQRKAVESIRARQAAASAAAALPPLTTPGTDTSAPAAAETDAPR